MLAKRFSFVVIVILLHTLVKLVRSHHCLFVCCLYFCTSFISAAIRDDLGCSEVHFKYNSVHEIPEVSAKTTKLMLDNCCLYQHFSSKSGLFSAPPPSAPARKIPMMSCASSAITERLEKNIGQIRMSRWQVKVKVIVQRVQGHSVRSWAIVSRVVRFYRRWLLVKRLTLR